MPTVVGARPQPAAGFVPQRLFAVRAGPRTDRFARLVREVADDPASPFNIERYLWVLEEAAPEPCEGCGTLFVPSFDYEGAPAKGQARRYCTRVCARRAGWGRADERRRGRRRAARRTEPWGSAA